MQHQWITQEYHEELGSITSYLLIYSVVASKEFLLVNFVPVYTVSVPLLMKFRTNLSGAPTLAQIVDHPFDVVPHIRAITVNIPGDLRTQQIALGTAPSCSSRPWWAMMFQAVRGDVMRCLHLLHFYSPAFVFFNGPILKVMQYETPETVIWLPNLRLRALLYPILPSNCCPFSSHSSFLHSSPSKHSYLITQIWRPSGWPFKCDYLTTPSPALRCTPCISEL